MSGHPGRMRAFLLMGVLLALPALSGCEAWRRQSTREIPLDSERVLADPVARDPSFTRPEELSGFFRGGRDQGTWSSEGRDIEKSLGVIR